MAGPASANPLLLLAVALSALLLLGGVYLPVLSVLLGTQTLSGLELAIAIGVTTLPAIAIEIVKAVHRTRSAETGRPDDPDAEPSHGHGA